MTHFNPFVFKLDRSFLHSDQVACGLFARSLAGETVIKLLGLILSKNWRHHTDKPGWQMKWASRRIRLL